MNDTINRQAAINAICKHGTDLERRGITVLAVVNHKQATIDLLETLPSAQTEPQWIPVSERLPEEPFGCLVTVWDTNPVTMDEVENILPYFVGWDGKQWNDGDGEQCPFEVIAWMPLPEPWKGEEDETD